MKRYRFLFLYLFIQIGLTHAANYTTSKSLIGSSGSFNTAGFTLTPYTFNMTGSVVAGFSMNVPTNITSLFNGGITNPFCGSFILVNADTNAIVNLYLDSGATKTQAVVQPTHSVAIDGAPSRLWVALSGFANTNAVPSNNVALISWAYADQ